MPKKILSWADEEDEEYEREQLAKLEKEKSDFEQYKTDVLKNTVDWSMKVLLSDAKSKHEIDNIIEQRQIKAEQEAKAKAERDAKAEQEAKAKAEQEAKAEQTAKAERDAKAKRDVNNQNKERKPNVRIIPVNSDEKKLDYRFYTKPPTINKDKIIVNNTPSNLKYNKKPDRLKTVTSSRFFMDGNKKYNKVPEDQDWYVWNYDTETMLPYGWRKVGTFPDKYLTSDDSPFTLIHNEDGTWSVQETYSTKMNDGSVRTITEYITIEYYIWCLTPPYYRKSMKQPAAN